MAFAEIGDVKIYYNIKGEGYPLVLVCGWGFDQSAWVMQIEDFSERFQVITFDNRGIGRTESPDGPFTIDEMVEDLKGLVDHLELGTFNLLGVSLGAVISGYFTVKYRDRVNRLVLACISGPPYKRACRVIDGWGRIYSENGSLETLYRNIIPWGFTVSFCEDDEEVETMLELMMSIQSNPPKDSFWRQADVCMKIDLNMEMASRILVPTLVMGGKEDHLFPPDTVRNLSEMIDGSKLRIINDGGHLMFIEDPQTFNNTVIEFLCQ